MVKEEVIVAVLLVEETEEEEEKSKHKNMLCFQLRIMTHKIAFYCLLCGAFLISSIHNPESQFSFLTVVFIFYVCRHPFSRPLHHPSLSEALKKSRASKPPLNVISRETTTKAKRVLETASWWRSNSNLTKGNNTHLWLACIYSTQDKASGGESAKAHRGRFKMCFPVFFFSIFASQYFMDLSPFSLSLSLSLQNVVFLSERCHMIPQVIVTPGYVC